MLNRIVVIGRLTRDPELRSTSNGVAVATFTVAVDRNFSNNRGERETDFIPVIVITVDYLICRFAVSWMMNDAKNYQSRLIHITGRTALWP